MTRVFITFGSSGDTKKTYAVLDYQETPISVLVSFVFDRLWKQTRATRPRPLYTMLDSGAYSAWNSGKEIDLDALIEESKSDEWDEAICLDVINEPEASLHNALYMKANGSPAYPVFHIHDPWEHLDEYVRQFPKVGLSCRFGEPPRDSYKWLNKCFTRIYPFACHSFGWTDRKMLATFPFHSCDTASWVRMPRQWGAWKSYGRARISVRRRELDLRPEIEFYLELERYLKARWAKEMRRFERLDPRTSRETLCGADQET